MERSDYAAAIVASKSALAVNNRDAISWLTMAEANEKLGKQTDALKCYRELIYPKDWSSNVNTDPTTRMKYVLALTRSNIWPEAVAVYEQSVPWSIDMRGARIRERTFTSDRREFSRIEALSHLIIGSRNPSFGPALPGEKMKHLAAALKLQPRMGLAHYLYGIEMQRQMKFDSAQTALAKAVSLGDSELKMRARLKLKDVDRTVESIRFQANHRKAISKERASLGSH